ncbi:polyamine ABC transporter substrate-binding protein [Endozoicomonas atrinae]|uniref:polyamine ABC transporter substrate-binding protein n=1 Tax=Endozoicomonas atrinae TaxID=1333660 RepID=UPI000AA2B1F9|nr:polyamine ABC transporter substrate-binding protein [Endozoicomonas atrinae]
MKLHTICAMALTMTISTLLSADDKVLKIYNWSDYFGPETLSRFEEQTGITIQYDVFASNEVLESKLLLGKIGYDLVFPAASNAAKQLQAGALQPIDSKRLKHYDNLDPSILQQLSQYSQGMKPGVPYTWGTVGLAYNVAELEKRLPGVEVNSLDVLFNPSHLEKLKSCGISLLDSPGEMISITLNYLGHDPYSSDKKVLAEAEELLQTIRPYISYIDSQKQILDLAAGDVCLALAYSGDAGMAQIKAEESGSDVTLAYSIPIEGSVLWFDMMAIPIDAPNPELAYQFIDYILQPEVIAEVSNAIYYANPNKASLPLIDKEITDDPNIFPTHAVKSKLFIDKTLDSKATKVRNRVWTRFKIST